MTTNWHARFINLARYIASEWSKDPSTKVGAVIVNAKRNPIGMGYNGFPRGIKDTEERLNDRPTKYSLVVHAEANAILNATASIEGTTLYCTHFPCGECAKLIIQVGITTIYVPADARIGRWAKGHEVADAMFKEAGVETFVVPNI